MKKKIKKEITSKTTLAQILKKTGTVKILIKYKVPCLTCPMAKFELEKLTIGQIAQKYGLNLKKILSELNKLVNL